MADKTIDKNIVLHAANLARIKLSERESQLYEKQLREILNYVNKLNELDTKCTPPTSHPIENLKNVFRKDGVKPSLSREGALRNAPDQKNGFFIVPRII